jgi:hypothetical protein
VTAEVALINRRAVTLAADSAVSLVGPGADEVKIFNSAEKIFELCDHLPIGLMVYNNIDHLRAPLEILAREYRNQCKTPHATVFDCADDFLEYLRQSAANAPVAVQDDDIVRRVNDEMGVSRTRALHRFMGQTGANVLSPAEMVLQVLQERLAELRAGTAIQSHSTIDWNDVYNDHKAPIDKSIEDARKSLRIDDANVPIVIEIAARSLLSEELSDNLTGIVIAGYGSDGMYPALVAYEIDGFVCGQLRLVENKRVQIEPGVQSVDIITFAQEDISRRLLDGVDPEIVATVNRQLLAGVRLMKRNALANVSGAQRAQVEQDFDGASANLLGTITRTVQTFIDKCNSDFRSTVASMPKQEMAFFAEALVNTTAMKRRVSKDREDVGGPVDVAVISRHEGFVWVQRKHYFDAERNPRFFARRFGPTNPGNGGQP